MGRTAGRIRITARALLGLLAALCLVALPGCLEDAGIDLGSTTGGEPALATSSIFPATVSRHTDGDTAWFDLDGGFEEKVRFIGVDTPEVFGKTEAFGRDASAYTAEAIPLGAEVWLETDAELRDQYGRLLAYVWLGEPTARDHSEVRANMLNARLLRDGLAQVSTYPPNVKYVEMFEEIQRDARERGVGFWAIEQ